MNTNTETETNSSSAVVLKEGWIQRKGIRGSRAGSAPNTSFVGHFSTVAPLPASSQHPHGNDDKKQECDDDEDVRECVSSTCVVAYTFLGVREITIITVTARQHLACRPEDKHC